MCFHIKKELIITSATMFIVIVTDTVILFIGFEEPTSGTKKEINEKLREVEAYIPFYKLNI